MQRPGVSAVRPRGMRCAHTLRWTGVPRAGGVRDVPTDTGGLGPEPRSRARAAADAATLGRERERLREELCARRVVQAQLSARLRRAERRLTATGGRDGVRR